MSDLKRSPHSPCRKAALSDFNSFPNLLFDTSSSQSWRCYCVQYRATFQPNSLSLEIAGWSHQPFPDSQGTGFIQPCRSLASSESGKVQLPGTGCEKEWLRSAGQNWTCWWQLNTEQLRNWKITWRSADPSALSCGRAASRLQSVSIDP